MKFELFTLIILVGFVQLNNAGPIRFFKRAAFYIANETACVVDNTVYFNGEPIPTDDPCEACKCRPPGFACVLKECEVKPGCRAVRRAGYCCPEYICGCEHNGRMYRDGDEIKDSLNPCFVCHCQGSSIACSFVDCFFRVDCAPEYVSGECCPHYNNCIPISPENQDPFSHGDNAQSSIERPLPVATLLTILTEGSTSAEETFSPDITESSESPDERNKEETDSSLIFATNEETEIKENVEKSEETYTTQNTEKGSSYAENDATDLEKDISMEEPVNNISLNSGMDLSVEESKEEAKEEEEIMTAVDEKNPEVVALSTEESKIVDVATTSVTNSPITELAGMSEGSTEKLDGIATIQAMDETILPEEKRKSMKFHEDEETPSDIVSKENPESITKDQSKEQTSGTEASMTEEEILSGTKIQLFSDASSTEKSEASSETNKESTQMYEDMTSETKDSTNGDVETEKFIDEVVTNGEKKPKAEDNTETVTLVVLVEDSDDQSVEKTDQPEEEKLVIETEQPVEEAEQPIQEAALSVEEAEQPVEEAALSVEKTEQPIENAALSVEVAELPVEKEEQPTEGLDQSKERVGQPTNDVPVDTSAQAGPENRYKALDEAILSAFIPDDSPSADESLDEKKNLSTEISEIVEKEDTLDQTEPLTISLIESTKLPEAEEMTSMNVGGTSDTEEKPTEDIAGAEENDR